MLHPPPNGRMARDEALKIKSQPVSTITSLHPSSYVIPRLPPSLSLIPLSISARVYKARNLEEEEEEFFFLWQSDSSNSSSTPIFSPSPPHNRVSMMTMITSFSFFFPGSGWKQAVFNFACAEGNRVVVESVGVTSFYHYSTTIGKELFSIRSGQEVVTAADSE